MPSFFRAAKIRTFGARGASVLSITMAIRRRKAASSAGFGWRKRPVWIGDRVMRCEEILPAVRYAVDAYLDLVKNRSFLEAVASSLTELFSRDLISLRMDCMRQHYPWLSNGLDYFTARLHQAPEDARFALQWVIEHAQTRAEQELAMRRLQAKCDILWAQLDAIYFAYVQPGWPPPGAFRVES